MISIELDTFWILEHCFTDRRNVGHYGAEGGMQ